MLILDTVGKKTMWGSEGEIGDLTEESAKSKRSGFCARTRFHWIISSNKQENMERYEKEYETTKIFFHLLTLQDRVLHPSTKIRDNKFKVFSLNGRFNCALSNCCIGQSLVLKVSTEVGSRLCRSKAAMTGFGRVRV